MKKLTTLLAIFVCVFALAGCGEQRSTGSFHGEHEYFAVSGGSITLDGQEATFDGGNLEITQSDAFAGVTSYSTTFYLLADSEQKVILSSSRSNPAGKTIAPGGSLGGAAGEGILGSGVRMDDLKDALWFELKTTALDGTESVYRIQLSVTD